MCESVFLAFMCFSKRTDLCKKNRIYFVFICIWSDFFLVRVKKQCFCMSLVVRLATSCLHTSLLNEKRGSNWSRSKRGDLWSKLDYKMPLKTTPILTMFFIMFHLSGSSADTVILHLKTCTTFWWSKSFLPLSFLDIFSLPWPFVA